MQSSKRSVENGPLKFNKGTEDNAASFVLKNSEKGNPASVISFFDKYCWENHWMMNVGDAKGQILDNIIKKTKPEFILELGTYCAYSTIRMGQYLPENGKIYTIDPYPIPASKLLAEHAGLKEKIIFLEGQANNVIPTLSFLKGKIDLVFIDHDKKMYLSDLLLIEKMGLLHPGSTIVADNVIIFKINDYLNHVRNSGNYSSSINHISTLEYDDTKRDDRIDGIEESVWMG